MKATNLLPAAPNWLASLRRYLAFTAAAHLAWEFAHIPLYKIWLTGTAREIVFAAVHCAGGDLLIALSAIMLSLMLFGSADWPEVGPRRVFIVTVVIGLGYTIFSEWLNIVVREAWAYRDIMPVIPGIDAGLSPVLQWIIVPSAAYGWAIGYRPWRRLSKGAAHG